MSSGSPPFTILAHRGWWHRVDEKNTPLAIERAFAAGFGIEIDVRDINDDLAVAHDVPEPDAYPFSHLFPLFRKFPALCVAINVKSCGLQQLLIDAIREAPLQNYFTFDMAVPDLLTNIKAGLISFTRISEIETVPALYEQATGIWLDMFEYNWISADSIANQLGRGKDVALVSPELHKRPHLDFWQYLKDNRDLFTSTDKKVYVCTDYPAEAAAILNV